jgi:patatin-like phospholipase/acyl hydrolase
MKHGRVVTFDGTSPSGGFGYVGAGVLAEVQRQAAAQFKGASVLGQVDAYAGTSAGSWTALYVASQRDPSAALSSIVEQLWQPLLMTMSQSISLSGGIETLTGLGALLDSRKVRAFFCDFFGSRTRLGDLHHPVMITSFQLDDPDALPRRWRARVFNSIDPSSPDLDELVVDVAMRSSSPPVLNPIYQSLRGAGPGYIDGGVFANDPSMVAYTQMLHARTMKRIEFDDVLLFSFGNGQLPRYLSPRFCGGLADWGYSRWLLDLRDPLAAIDLMIEAGMLMTAFQAEQIMGTNYQRLDPYLGKVNVLTPNAQDAVDQIIEAPNTQAQISATLGWLERSGWLQRDQPVQQEALS